jgi:hypothetical protein
MKSWQREANQHARKFDSRNKEYPASNSDLDDAKYDPVVKAKYTRREGEPGNYRYFYDTGQGEKERGHIPEQDDPAWGEEDPNPDRSLPGMEGPFTYPSGQELYYDPREAGGSYYDRGQDRYLSHDEAWQAMQPPRSADEIMAELKKPKPEGTSYNKPLAPGDEGYSKPNPNNPEGRSQEDLDMIWGSKSMARLYLDLEKGNPNRDPTVGQFIGGGAGKGQSKKGQKDLDGEVKDLMEQMPGEEIEKAKYTRREGSPGNYRYYYEDDEGKERVSTKPLKTMAESSNDAWLWREIANYFTMKPGVQGQDVSPRKVKQLLYSGE